MKTQTHYQLRHLSKDSVSPSMTHKPWKTQNRVCTYFELGNDGSGIPRGHSLWGRSHTQLLGTSRSPSQTDPPSCLKHHAKSQATGQKTQLFSAVTLLNLMFPASSLSPCLLRARCIFGLHHMVLHATVAIHSAGVISKWAVRPHP